MVVDPKELITFLEWLPDGLGGMAGGGGVRGRGGDGRRLAADGDLARAGVGHANHVAECCATPSSISFASRRGAPGRWPGWRFRSRFAAAWWSCSRVFIVLLLFAGWYLDRESIDPARLYLDFVLTATSYLVLLLALFLSSQSLPADIKNHTIYTVVTKPVRASEVVLGRIVGFTAVTTFLLVVMGLISYVFVERGLAHTHQLTAADLEPIKGGVAGTPAGLARPHQPRRTAIATR